VERFFAVVSALRVPKPIQEISPILTGDITEMTVAKATLSPHKPQGSKAGAGNLSLDL